MEKVVLGILAALFAFNFASAQRVLSLEDCIKRAEEVRLDLQQMDISRRSAALNYQQSKNNFLPSVNGSISTQPQWQPAGCYRADLYRVGSPGKDIGRSIFCGWQFVLRSGVGWIGRHWRLA